MLFSLLLLVPSGSGHFSAYICISFFHAWLTVLPEDEAVSKTLLMICQTVWCHIPEESNHISLGCVQAHGGACTQQTLQGSVWSPFTP